MQHRAADLFTKKEIAQLSKRSNWQGAWLITHCWLVIFATWAICVQWTHPLVILCAIPVIGARQLGLFIISHDAAHHLLFTNRRLNDWVAEWLLGRALLGGSILPYRKYHFVHHRFTQQDNDPDLHLSKPFPISRQSLHRKIFRDLSGQTGWKQRVASLKSAGFSNLAPNLLINLVFLGVFHATGKVYLYVLLWLVPYMTWNLLVTRIRNIGEHAAVPDNHDRLRNTRTTLVNPLERLLISPYFVNYHLEHHLLVSAPCYNLPKVHALLKKKGLLPQMEVQSGYLNVLRLAAPA